MRMELTFLIFVLFGCGQSVSNNSAIDNNSNDKVKEELLLLERKWLDAEFALDTAYVSTLLDPTFIGISANRISSKQEELKGMYDNISALRPTGASHFHFVSPFLFTQYKHITET